MNVKQIAEQNSMSKAEVRHDLRVACRKVRRACSRNGITTTQFLRVLRLLGAEWPTRKKTTT